MSAAQMSTQYSHSFFPLGENMSFRKRMIPRLMGPAGREGVSGSGADEGGSFVRSARGGEAETSLGGLEREGGRSLSVLAVDLEGT